LLLATAAQFVAAGIEVAVLVEAARPGPAVVGWRSPSGLRGHPVDTGRVRRIRGHLNMLGRFRRTMDELSLIRPGAWARSAQ
jgi:hypothetical protein